MNDVLKDGQADRNLQLFPEPIHRSTLQFRLFCQSLQAPTKHPHDVVTSVQLSCVLTNLRSIVNKLNDVLLYSPDIFALTETHLNPDIPSSLLPESPLYHIYRKDRNRHSGGICLFVMKLPNVGVRLIEIPPEYDMLELVAVDLTNRSHSTPLRIILAYRPPGYSIDNNNLFIRHYSIWLITVLELAF